MNTISKARPVCGQSDRESAFALAITVLRDRVSSLTPEDKDDLYELLPFLLGDDEEARESAQVAVREILDQKKLTISRDRMENPPGGKLQKWLDFVSDRLRQARKDSDLTQEELAEASGIPQSYISRLERGRHSPSSKTLETLAKALNVPVSMFDPSAE